MEVKFLITHFKCSKVIFEAIFYNQYRSYSDDVHMMKTRPVNSNNNCDWREKMQHTMLHEYLFSFININVKIVQSVKEKLVIHVIH